MFRLLSRFLGLVILFTAPSLLFAQTELRYSQAELLSLLSNAPNAAKRVEYNVELSNFFLYNKSTNRANTDSALHYVKQAQDAAQQLKDPSAAQSIILALAAVKLKTGDPGYVLNKMQSVSPLIRARLLILTGTYYVYKPHEDKKDLDSALLLFNTAKAIGNKLNNSRIWHLAELYTCDVVAERGEKLRAKARFAALVNICSKSGDLEIAASAASREGDYLPLGNERLEVYQRAMDLFQQAGNLEEQIGMEKAIADVMLNMGLLDQSETKLLHVLHQYRSLGYKNLQFTYDLLSVVSRLKGNLRNALTYAIDAIDAMKKTGSDASEGYFYASLGSAYAELGRTTESVRYYQRSLASMHDQNEDAKMTSLKMLSEELIKKGHVKEVLNLAKSYDTKEMRGFGRKILATIRGNSYAATGNYRLAERYYLEMVKWQSTLRTSNFHWADSYYTIGEFYIRVHAYKKAEYYLQKVVDIQKGSFPLSKITNTYLYLYQADSAQNNLGTAITNYKHYKTLSDSLQNATRNKNIQEILIEYETTQKDQENELLRKESALQKNELHRAALTTRITIGGLIALSFIIALLFYSFRNRKKASQLMLSHQQEITLKNDSLQHLIERQAKLLSEKEWLIKEIHHRIKNNLQVITSLLNAQSHYLHDDAALKAIRDSQNRIQSISLIHQKLFQSESVALVNISSYTTELMKFLCDTFHVDQRIQFEFDIPAIELDVVQAMPIGLIINEAITNIIKYAFPEGGYGKVSISLSDRDGENYHFEIRDNGIGLPGGPDYQHSQSLGMTLMKGLGEQLGGTVSIESDHGVRVRVQFPKEFHKED